MLGLRLSDRQAKWIAFFKLIVLARVGYAAVLFVLSRLELLGVPTILSTDEHMVALLFSLNPFIHALWTVYVAGYVAAAILIWRNDPRGPLVYIAAFLLDAALNLPMDLKQVELTAVDQDQFARLILRDLAHNFAAN